MTEAVGAADSGWGYVPGLGDEAGVAGGSLDAFVAASVGRMRVMNRNIRSSVAEMRERTAAANDLQLGLEKLQAMRMAAAEMGGDGIVGAEELFNAGIIDENSHEAFQAFIDQLNEEYHLNIPITPRPDSDHHARVVGSAIDAAVETMTSRINRLNSSTELDMVNLQGMLESRSQQIQLITQITRGEHESEMGVIRNIGGGG